MRCRWRSMLMLSAVLAGGGAARADGLIRQLGAWELWHISDDSPNRSCMMVTASPGGTRIALAYNVDGPNEREVQVMLSNPAWKVPTGRLEGVVASIDGKPLTQRNGAHGMSAPAVLSVSLEGSPETVALIRGGSKLRVDTASGVLAYDLKGTAAALRETMRCTEELATKDGRLG